VLKRGKNISDIKNDEKNKIFKFYGKRLIFLNFMTFKKNILSKIILNDFLNNFLQISPPALAHKKF
jgi:hypothetical protein